MKIWSHTLVRNEERYVWYALRSVVDHVDKMLVWDTGSDDNTVDIIKEFEKLFPDKIEFREVGKVDPIEFTKVSQEMLESTKSDWILLLDGDEVWWDMSVKRVVGLINNRGGKLETIVQPYYNMIGDIYHYQEEEAGMYEFDNKRGHLTIRFMSNKIPGLHYAKEHGQRGLFDRSNKLIQERSRKKRIFLKERYMHFTNLPRSSSREKDKAVPKRAFKYKYEVGTPFPKEFYFPEVFFKDRPEIVSSVWRPTDSVYKLKAGFQTPAKKIKRRMKIFERSGY